MAVLSIIISTVIAVTVVFILRFLDRDNNSMDKVKRYADNRIAQLDEYFKEQISKLNGLSADLDTHQTAAVAAVYGLTRFLAAPTKPCIVPIADYKLGFIEPKTLSRPLKVPCKFDN